MFKDIASSMSIRITLFIPLTAILFYMLCIRLIFCSSADKGMPLMSLHEHSAWIGFDLILGCR